MHIKTSRLFLPLLAVALLGATVTHAEPVDDEDQLRQIFAAIEYGWESADGTPFYRHFLGQDDARYVETGGQNTGLDDLVEYRVKPEGDLLDGLDLVFGNLETHVEGDFAWALADVEVKATVKKDGRQSHSRGYETFLFRRTDNGWKVVHTHSSTRPVR